MPHAREDDFDDKNWEVIEKKHEMWISDRDTFCLNLQDPKNEQEYLMEEARRLSALISIIHEEVEAYWGKFD